MPNQSFRNVFFVAILAVFAAGLAGCHLYLGDGDDSYCDEWGCADEPNDVGGNGWSCSSNIDCAAGCYCSGYGYCQEYGFCASSVDCPSGFTCDERSTCVPDGAPPGGGEPPPIERCTLDSECSDDFVCDTSRGLCIPPYIVPPGPNCQGPIGCEDAAPVCPIGSTPAIEFGCYTGDCIVDSDCPDGAPLECIDRVESACIADATCRSVYRGVNCTSDIGDECTSGSVDCTCESFQFDYCEEG